MEVPTAALPDTGSGVVGVRFRIEVSRETLEVALENEHVGPSCAHHLPPNVEPVITVDVKKGTTETVKGVLGRVAHERHVAPEG
jgi:hypothetical protein